ncbi:chaplin [Kitasatospora sp. NPDC018619]|uniref:chaplin n=1 Tax=unclassified Kitasatospora TaxID=2633591 RepID=UPI003792BF0D
MATGSVLASTAGYAYAGGAEAQGVAAGSAGVVSGNSVQVPIEVPINACGNTVDLIGLLNPSFGNRCANVNGGGHTAAKPVQSGRPGGSGVTGGGTTGGGPGTVDGSGTGGSQVTGLPGAGLPGTAVPGAAVPGTSVPGAGASGVTANSPGVISGNSVQAPVDVPVNACGNSVNVVGVGNPAFGNDCANVEKVAPKPPVEGCDEACPTPPQVSAEREVANVARTGATATAATAVEPPAAAPLAAPAPTAQLASTGAGGVELLGAAGLALLLGGGVLYRRARAGAR